jgi:hypothetical protein
VLAEIAAAREARRKAAFAYQPDLAQVRTIDLRRFCNRGFIDAKPDDGVGGWTDQGRESSLDGVPWGVTNLLGVPCDLIRFDMNNDRTCIVLASEKQVAKLPEIVPDIPVGGKIRAMYFFHALGWPTKANTPGLTYRVHYASGKVLDVPALIGRDIGNWWGTNAKQLLKIQAFANRQGRCFYCMEWLNPTPEDEIRSVALVSPCNQNIPIVVAITVENYVPRKELPFDDVRGIPWGGSRTEQNGNAVECILTSESRSYCGFNVRPVDKKRVFDLTVDEWKRGELIFEVNGGKDIHGNHKPPENLRVALTGPRPPDQKIQPTSLKRRIHAHIPGGADNLPDTFQTVRIPLKYFLPKDDKIFPINGLNFQYDLPQAGMVIRNVRFVIPE